MLLPDSLTDKLIRLKLGVHKTPLDRFEVRIARTVRDYERAFRLLHVAYVFQGIEDVESERMRITKQHVLPESTVLVALEGEKLVATMTVTLDSSAGLPFDEDYPQQMQELRKSKARIVEYGSLAIVRRCWHSGVGRLMEIAGHAWSTRVLGATHCVAGVNPAAVPHYRALYGFQKVGAPRAYHDLDAPVQGLVVDFSEALAHIGRCFTKPLPDGRLYHEHLTGKLADCIKVPTEVALEDLVRWKLPREVFQELFIAKSDRLYSLDSKTLEHLRRWRTDTTLHPPVRGSSGS